MRSRLTLTFLAAALAAAGAASLTSSAQDQQEKVEAIFNRIEDGRGSNLADGIRELEELGRGSLDSIRKGLTRADAYVRIAVGKVLYHHELREEGLEALSKAMESKNAAARRVAADLAASLAIADTKLSSVQKKGVSDHLRKIIEAQDDDLTRVALWRGVYGLTETIDARRKVRDILEKAKRREVKDDAALALAEMDAFIWAKGHLRELAAEPSERGRLARAYLKINEQAEDLSRALDRRGGSGGKYDYRMLDEVIDKLKEHYHDAGKVEDVNKLIEAAARGLLGSLDPYSSYYDEKAIEQLRKEELEGHYGGIGARVSMRKDKTGTSWLTIEEPIFSGPAYRAGLRTYDTIREVEGEATMNLEVSDLVKKMRGKPGTDVRLKVYRTGWTKEREFVIKREEIQLETTMSRLLPGQIGYVKYSTFGDLDEELKNKGANIETMIGRLKEQGMKALVLDLRGNSGGYLRTAKRIASLFLEHEAIVLTTKARGIVKETYKSDNKDAGGAVTAVPILVLVDGGSASASEILAGALQDHKRATLIGEKTFGKGSVQDLKMLEATKDNPNGPEKTAARITIAKWFLPSGRSVEKENVKESGVEPDIKIPAPEREFWKEAEFDRLRADGKVIDYVEKSFKEHAALFAQLADVDYGDASKYPGFDPLYDSLGSKASKDEVRELIREVVRKKVQDDQGKALHLDFQTDVVLQRGITEACAKAGIDVKNIKEYGVFAVGKRKDEGK